MLVMVDLLGNEPMAEKYEQTVVLESAFCWQRWGERQDAAETGFLCSSSVASIVMESPYTLFFCKSRKRMADRAWRKA